MFPQTKFLTKSLSRVPLRFFSTPERLGPEYDRREFDAYKYEYEKTQSHLGYSLEELFGKRYGLKHSETIRKEMRKDNYVLVLAVILAGVFIATSRSRRYDENVAFSNYVHRNMHTVRPIPEHARPKEYQDGKF